MCGIVGIMQFDGQPMDQGVLEAMTASLAHRGSEGRGTRMIGPAARVGLGHTRLKVIDLSDAANQPMANDDGSVWVVFNGEIYNFRQLRTRLEGRGYHCRTSSDTEVLLRLYEAEGERCVNTLDGMFAFAIWDGRRGCLLMARDRVGKKPLFYRSTPQLFAFASEIKALLQHPDIAPIVDEDALPAFFLYGYVPTPNTFYRGIQKLPPGHLLRIGMDGQVRVEAYWDLPMAVGNVQEAPTQAAAKTRVRELVTEAVRKRLIADVPLGAFLSGGIDSSIVVGIMSRLMREPVRTFSIGFSKDHRFDETSYARLASRRFGTTHTEFVVEPAAVDLVERLVWHHDGPFADSSAIPTYLLSRLTRQHVTVALNGDGGDELFAGYLRFYATLLSERIPLWLRRTASGLFSRVPEWGGHRSLVRQFQKLARSAALPFDERFSRWISVFYEDLPRLFSGDSDGSSEERAGGNTNGHAPIPLGLLEPYLSKCAGASGLTRLLYLNFKTYLLDDLLVKMDRCSMAHALEARSPFLDRELIEYVFSLPDAMKLRRGRTKVILREAFADLVPPEILHRGKMGFGVPLRAWFTQDLRDYLHDVLLAPDAKLRRYLDQRYVKQLYSAHVSGRADHGHRLWTLLTFEVWLRQLPGWAAQPAAERFPDKANANRP